MFLKFVIVGQSGVGKTTILQRFLGNPISDKHQTTIGVEFASKTIPVKDSRMCKLQIWDTTGKDAFFNLVSSFYQKAHCIIFVYDVTQRQTLDEVSRWKEDATEKVNQETIFLLVGNKSDQESSREVTYAEGIEYMINNDFHLFTETSAMTGTNVDFLFRQVTKYIFEKGKILDEDGVLKHLNIPEPDESNCLCFK